MSLVTNLIVCASVVDDNKLEDANSYFVQKGEFGLVSVDDPKLPDGWYGGHKRMETEMWIGAFNYLDFEAFMAHLRTLSWRKRDSVQVIVKADGRSVFSLLTLDSPEEQGQEGWRGARVKKLVLGGIFVVPLGGGGN